MKSTYSVLCSLMLLTCLMSRTTMALYSLELKCSLECTLYGTSRVCSCSQLTRDLDLSLPLAEQLEKRDRPHLPFRFGKRQATMKGQSRLPFRYGKRSAPQAPSAPHLGDILFQRPSAYYLSDEE